MVEYEMLKEPGTIDAAAAGLAQRERGGDVVFDLDPLYWLDDEKHPFWNLEVPDQDMDDADDRLFEQRVDRLISAWIGELDGTEDGRAT